MTNIPKYLDCIRHKTYKVAFLYAPALFPHFRYHDYEEGVILEVTYKPF
jgi:hypothetical protein